ncbi:MAG: hypothetical protein KDD47_25550, partial [Acidobacteria bacterium]|nr:hypothetical protein [Acidobacteriota bacterium]
SYLAGRMESAAARSFEGRLARSREGRRRLAELADSGRGAVGPDPELRGRVLETFKRPRGGRHRRFSRAAAILAAGFLLVVVGFVLRPLPLPEDFALEVHAQGIASERAGPTSSDLVEALPDTRVRIHAAAKGKAVSGLRFALYLRKDQRLLRLRVPEPTTTRGGVTFSALARDLVGDQPGSFELFVAATRQRRLPAVIAIEAGQEPRAALGIEGRRPTVPIRLVLLSEADPSMSRPETPINPGDPDASNPEPEPAPLDRPAGNRLDAPSKPQG